MNDNFLISEFSRWLKAQDTMQKTKKEESISIDSMVEPRLGINMLSQKIKEYNKIRNVNLLAEEFKNKGGKVIEIIEENIKIETQKGKFILPKSYTKILDNA